MCHLTQFHALLWIQPGASCKLEKNSANPASSPSHQVIDFGKLIRHSQLHWLPSIQFIPKSYKWLVWCVGPEACVLNHDTHRLSLQLWKASKPKCTEVKVSADPEPKSWNSTQTEFLGLALRMTPGTHPILNCPKETFSSLGPCGSPRKQHWP